MLTRDNEWGDDFAAYIMQAQSIVRGDMAQYVEKNSFTMLQSSHPFGPVTEPWGFPLMLAPVYAIFGLKVLALKLVLVVCYALFLLAFFFLARSRLAESEATLLTAVLAFSPLLLAGENQILSDIPFTFFSTLALWLITQPRRAAPGTAEDLVQGVLVGAVIFAGVFTRLAGLLLFVPLIATQIGRLPGAARTASGIRGLAASYLGPYAAFGLLYAAQARVFPSVGQAAPFGHPTVETLLKNLQDYFWSPSYFLAGFAGGARLVEVLLLVFVLASVAAHYRRDLPIHLYALAMLAIYIAREGFREPRYVYPLWPLFVLFAYDGMQVVADRFASVMQRRARAFAWDLFVVFAILSFGACVQIGWANMASGRYDYRPSWGAFSPASSRMFEWIRDKTPEDSVIIFFKPRAMRLRTDRDAFFTTNCDDLPKGNYVAIVKSIGTYDQISPQVVRHCNPSVTLTPAYEKDDFVVYRLDPAQ